VGDWVRHQLMLLTADARAAPPGGRRGILVGSPGAQPAGARGYELLLGTIDLLGRKHGGTMVNGTAPGRLHCSLRAVAAACEALNSGQYDLVLAGGVTTGVGAWTGGHHPAPAHVRVYDASPTGMAWKFPPCSSRPSNVIGLSWQPSTSRASTLPTWSSWSSTAPSTCGAQRRL